MNQRRTLLTALGALGAGSLTGGLAGSLTASLAGALTASRPARAQPAANNADKVWRVGVLQPGGAQAREVLHAQRELPKALRAAGYVEGKNLVIDWRLADLNAERLKSQAEELVRLKVDVIVTANTTATHAVQKATSTLPVVMAASGDPVGSGFAKSLAKPGGNITGLSNLSPELGTKMLQMLLEITAAARPKLTRVAVMINPANSGHVLLLQNIQAAARITHSQILPLEVRNAADLATAFATLTRERSEALIIARDSAFGELGSEIAERALRLRLPTASGGTASATVGILMSIGPKRPDQFARVATYIDKIFKGTKPGDLPIEQPTLFEVIINGKTAKALGLKIPQALLISAERVIE